MDWFRTCDEVPEEYQRVGIGLCFGGQSKLFLLYIDQDIVSYSYGWVVYIQYVCCVNTGERHYDIDLKTETLVTKDIYKYFVFENCSQEL